MTTLTLVEPAHMWVPPRADTMADVVFGTADLAGLTLDPEQRLVIDAFCSVDEQGLWAAIVGCLIESRQNGKTKGVLAPIVLAELYDEDDPDRIVWTAHRFKTSRDAFTETRALIDNSDALRRRVYKVNESHGEESIELLNGALLEFLARSRMTARGLGGKLVVLDEGFALQGGMLGALLPTLSARPNPHVLVASSACMADSDQLRDLVKSGRAGGDNTLAYLEWCAPGSWKDPGCADPKCRHPKPPFETPGCALDDESLWALANHSLGRQRANGTGLTYRFVRQERRRLPPLEFGRERLGWHDDPAGGDGPPIAVEAWNRRKIPDLDLVDRTRTPVFFLDASPQMRSATIGVALPGAKPHVELAAHDAGTHWLLARAAQLKARHRSASWSAMAGGAIGALIPALTAADVCKCGAVRDEAHVGAHVKDKEASLAAGTDVCTCAAVRDEAHLGAHESIGRIDIELFTVGDMGRACSHLQSLVDNQAFTHSGDPLFTDALAGADKRDVGEGLWVWGWRVSTTDISPLYAATGALWALSQNPPYNPLANIW